MNDPTTPSAQLHRRVTQLEAELAAERARHRKIEYLLRVRLCLSEADPSLPLDALLRHLLGEVKQVTDSSIAFFHLYDEERQSISMETWSDHDLTSELPAAGHEQAPRISSFDPWKACVVSREPIIRNTLPTCLPHQDSPSSPMPMQRALVVPILRNQHIVAVIGAGNTQRHFTGEDVEQIAILGDLAWDIVLRRREESRLKESETRFHQLINDIPLVSIQGYGPDGTVRFWNPASEKLYGYSQEEAMGKSLLELIIPPEMRTVVEQDIAAMARTGVPIAPAELTLMRKDGSRVEVFSSHALIRPTEEEAELFCVDVDLSERKKIEENLAATLQEKEVLLKEVHHRVKNNLAAVIGLLDMQAHLPLDAGIRQTLIELAGRIRSMALAHEHLYQAESLANINIQHYLQALVSHLLSALPSPHIHFQVHALQAEASLDLAIPCGLIVNELVTNAIKYAFPEKRPHPPSEQCRVEVAMSYQQGTYTLKVWDNGIGLQPHFDPKQGQSLGMLLVRMLGEHQLGGQCTFDGRHGTAMTLTFAPGKRSPHEQSHTAHC